MERHSFDSHRAIQAMTDRLVGYIQRELGGQNADLLEKLAHAWLDPLRLNGLVSEVVLEGGFGYETEEETFADLMERGALHRRLGLALANAHEQFRVDPARRHPYVHQRKAFAALAEGRSTLISVGTGSGKTECFLYPIISDLFREQDENRLDDGVRALFIYPTNALINSQRDRLAAWLATDTNLSSATPARFCLYNGALPENPARRLGEGGGPRCEIDSRTELRSRPPHMLITNYSMLEIMLIRPDDSPILARSRGKLRYIVIDEAHSYQGVMAAEIALLLRRTLQAFEVSPNDVRFVATSATFPGAQRKALERFAAEFFGCDPTRVAFIAGHRAPPEVPQVPGPGLDLPNPAGIVDLVRDLQTLVPDDSGNGIALSADIEQSRALGRRLTAAGFSVGDSFEQEPAALAIFHLLLRYPKLLELRSRMAKEGKLKLSEASSLLFGNAEEAARTATAQMLDLASLARPAANEQALIPARWHVVFQRPDTISACLNPSCNLRDDTLPPGWPIGAVALSYRPRCGCGAAVLPLAFCGSCGEVFLFGALERGDDGIERLKKANEPSSLETVLLRFRGLGEGEVRGGVRSADGALVADFEDGLLPVAILRKVTSCPACGSEAEASSDAFWRTFSLGSNFGAALVVEGLMQELPVDSRGAANRPNGGRRLVSFSDARQGAAQLAPYVERTLRMAAGRQVIFDVLHSLPDEVRRAVEHLERIVRRYPDDAETKAELERLRLLPPVQLEEVVRRIKRNSRWLSQLATDDKPESGMRVDSTVYGEFYRRPPRQASLETLGLVTVDYPGLSNIAAREEFRGVFTDQEWQDMAATLLDRLRTGGGSHVPYEVGEWLLPNTFGKRFDSDGRGDAPWLGTIARRYLQCLWNTTGKPSEERTIDRLAGLLWESVRDLDIFAIEGQWRTIDMGKLLLGPLTHCFRCSQTGVGFSRSVRDVSPASGRLSLEKIDWPVTMAGELRRDVVPELPEALGRIGREAIRVVGRRLLAVRASEHTAQIETGSLGEIERQFKDGSLNLLTSTTTMEMGVDVGQLPAVLLTNAPPSPSNYLQRAGRAGRRNEGSTLVVTMTGHAPHDAMLFRNPAWAFEAPGLPPRVRLDREVVVQRHVNALLLRLAGMQRDEANPLAVLGTCGDFFSGEPAFSTRLVQSLRREDGGCQMSWNNVGDRVARLVADTALEGESELSLAAECADQLEDLANTWRKEQAVIDRLLEEASARSRENILDRDLSAEVSRLQQIRREREKGFLLTWLAEKQFLPRYGFPTSVVRLDTGKRDGDGERHRLERDLEIGLREYGPGAEIVVAGRKYRSEGVLLDARQRYGGTTESGGKAPTYLRICENCGFLSSGEAVPSLGCPACGEEARKRVLKCIRPEGFSCELSHDQPHPSRATDQRERLPFEPPLFSPTHDATWTELVPGLFSRYARDGRIIFLNRGRSRLGFDICNQCGRAASRDHDRPTATFPRNKKKDGHHHKLRASRVNCDGHYADGRILQEIALIHEIATDTLELRLAGALAPEASVSEKFHKTLAVVLRDVTSEFLGVSVREVGGQAYRLPQPGGTANWAVVLYDHVPGGAGLMALAEEHLPRLLLAAVERLCGDRAHQLECRSSCHRCLLSFDTQYEAENLDRQVVLAHFDDARQALLKPPVDLVERFGSEARPIYGSELQVVQLISGARTIHIRADEVGGELASSAIFRALQRAAQRGRSVVLHLRRLPANGVAGGESDRALLFPLEELLNSPAGRILMDDGISAEPVLEIQRDSEWESFALLASNVPLVLGENWPGGSLVGNLPARLTGTLATATGQSVTAEEVRPASVKLIEVEKERIVERIVTRQGTGLRVAISQHSANTWTEILREINRQVQGTFGIDSPLGTEAPESASYSDRYLRSDRALDSLVQLLAATKIAPSVPFTVATNPVGERGIGLQGDYRNDDELRHRWQERAPGRKPIVLKTLAHARTLDLRYSNGRHWVIDLDQGVDIWSRGGRKGCQGFIAHVTLAD